MNKRKQISRRSFLALAGVFLAGISLGQLYRLLRLHLIGAPDVGLTPAAYLPYVARNAVPAPGYPRVIHVHAPEATDWDFSSGWYGDYVDQEIVYEMVDQGVIAMTGASSVTDAWRQLIPNYQPGKAIAIKVNFNNSPYNDPLQIDALPHPVNAIIRGLELIGVRQEDIWVYDARRCISDRFTGACLYPGIRFFDNWCHEVATFENDDPNALVHFTDHTQKIADVLVNATYLINMPILKRHAEGREFSVTLSFKNHYGTIETPGNLHQNRSSRLLTLNSNCHIRDKTRLVIGDALFGNRQSNAGIPARWQTFGNDAPNSLFFATDPVAIDSVMCDFLDREVGINEEPDEYLQSAAESGLGVYERGDPWQQPYGSGYERIVYKRIEMTSTQEPTIPESPPQTKPGCLPG